MSRRLPEADLEWLALLVVNELHEYMMNPKGKRMNGVFRAVDALVAVDHSCPTERVCQQLYPNLLPYAGFIDEDCIADLNRGLSLLPRPVHAVYDSECVVRFVYEPRLRTPFRLGGGCAEASFT